MSIIVLGNGPSVLDNEYGEIIDSFDNVVRINQYHPNMSKYVGMKTTIFVTCDYLTKYYKAIGESANRIIIWKDCDNKTPYDDHKQSIIIQKNPPNDDKYIDQETVTSQLVNDFGFARFHKGAWPSTGINILMYLIQTNEYDQIYIHGFDGLKFGEKNHYFENAMRTTKEHSSEKEIAFVNHYIEKGKLIRLEDSDYA